MTTTDTTTDLDLVTASVDAYLAAWNEEDAGRRGDLIAAAWDDAGAYADPMFEAKGHEQIDAMVAGLHAQMPGHRFRRTTDVDGHHGFVRFGWQLAGPTGHVVVDGIDVGVVGPDGRVQRIVGFFDGAPQVG